MGRVLSILMTMTFITVVAASVSASEPAAELAMEDPDPARLRLYAETGGLVAPGGVGPIGQLSARIWLWRGWSADVVGRTGATFFGSPDVNQFWTALAIGPSYRFGPPGTWALRVSTRVSHVHHASFTSWRETPGANALGDSDGGVRHRTGTELAVGIDGPPLGKIAHLELIWNADLSTGFLPSSEAMKLTGLVTAGFSLRGW